MGLLRRNKSTSGWSTLAPDQGPLEGVAKLRAEFGELRKRWGSKIRLLIPRGGGISGRILTIAEIVAEASSSAPGRVITATVCLVLAWRLIG